MKPEKNLKKKGCRIYTYNDKMYNSIKDIRPVCLYNAEKQKMIGIFSNIRVAATFLFNGEYPRKDYKRIHEAIRQKTTIIKNKLGFKVAVRRANEEQIKMLGTEEFILF